MAQQRLAVELVFEQRRNEKLDYRVNRMDRFISCVKIAQLRERFIYFVTRAIQSPEQLAVVKKRFVYPNVLKYIFKFATVDGFVTTRQH